VNEDELSRPPGCLVAAGQTLLAVAVFLGALALVFLLQLATSLPVEISPLGWWGYVTVAVGGAAVLSSVAVPVSRRRVAMLRAAVILVVLTLLVASAFHAVDTMLSGFSVVSVDARVMSPNGRLEARRQYVDEGALGGDSSVIVSGRLVPGLLTWSYYVPIPFDSYPDLISWRDDSTLLVNGREYRIPPYVVALSW
jgi:hypothetical protein